MAKVSEDDFLVSYDWGFVALCPGIVVGFTFSYDKVACTANGCLYIGPPFGMGVLSDVCVLGDTCSAANVVFCDPIELCFFDNLEIPTNADYDPGSGGCCGCELSVIQNVCVTE